MNEVPNRLVTTGLTSLPPEDSIDFDSKQMDWQGSGTEGFRYKPLIVDQQAGIRTLLMNVDAGAFTSMHAHDEVEQIYVLEGDLYDQDKSYGPGQLIVRAAGAMHTTGSKNGAVVLLFYSTHSSV